MNICTIKAYMNGRNCHLGHILCTIKERKQASNKKKTPNKKYPQNQPVLGTRLKGQIVWQLHQQAQSTQAESYTRFVSSCCCKTYCNNAGLWSPHLPLISAYGHRQPCCPDHIVLRPFGPYSALGHCQVTKDLHTVCTVIHRNRFSNSTVDILYSRHTTAPAESKLAHYYLCVVQMKYFSCL